MPLVTQVKRAAVVTVPPMYEFDSVSVSTYEASSLAAKLTERSSDGWDVVAIVPTGQRHHGVPAARDRVDDGATAAAADTASTCDAGAAEPPRRPRAASEPAGWGSAPETGELGHSTDASTTQLVGRRRVDAGRRQRRGARRRARHDAGRARRADHPGRARRVVRRPGRPLRAALLGRLGVDRARVPRRPAVHRPARRLTAGRPRRRPRAPTGSVDRAMMRATSLGHAGILIESDARLDRVRPVVRAGVLRLVVPVPPQRPARATTCVARIEAADYLYVSHLHGDHWDEPWLRDHLRRDIGVLLPGYPTRELERKMRALGFTELVRTTDGEELDLGGLTVAIHVETSHHRRPRRRLGARRQRRRGAHRRPERLPHDRPRRPARPTARSTCTGCSTAARSGTRWSTTCPTDELQPLVDAKVDSQLARAMRYVEAVGARAVVPSAGPPCFLDPDLFHLNVDRRRRAEHLLSTSARSSTASAGPGHRGILAVPGTTIDVDADGLDGAPPVRRRRGRRRSSPTRAPYLQRVPGRLAAVARRAQGDVAAPTPTPTSSPRCRSGGSRCWRWRRRCARRSAPACLLRAGDVDVLIDFPAGEVRPYAGEPYRYRFEIERPLVEAVVAERAVDWSNSLFLSCRFRAWRDGEFNEWVYNFFKSLSVERMRRTEAEAVRRLHPPTETEPDIELDGWIVQRRCPHRNADLAVFGEIDGRTLTCTLHGWRFDLRDRAAASPPPTTRSASAAPTSTRGFAAPEAFARALTIPDVSSGPRVGASAGMLPWTQTGMPIGIRPRLPDEVHRLHGDPHAAVRGRVVGHAVRAVHGDAADEVLRPVDLPRSPSHQPSRPLAVDVVQPVGRERDALDSTSPGVFWSVSTYALPVAGRRVEHPLRPAVDDDEEQLAGLVDLDEGAGVGPAVGLLGRGWTGTPRCRRRPRRRPARPMYFWNAITAWRVVSPYSPSAPVEPEAEVEQALLDARRLAAAARADGGERHVERSDRLDGRRRRQRSAAAGPSSVVGVRRVGGRRRRRRRRGRRGRRHGRGRRAVVAGVGGRRRRGSAVGAAGGLGGGAASPTTDAGDVEQAADREQRRRAGDRQDARAADRTRLVRPDRARSTTAGEATSGVSTTAGTVQLAHSVQPGRTAARTRSSGRA